MDCRVKPGNDGSPRQFPNGFSFSSRACASFATLRSKSCALAAARRPQQAGDTAGLEPMRHAIERDHAGAANARPDLRHLLDDNVHVASMPRKAKGE
jgi:hypothetical protein